MLNLRNVKVKGKRVLIRIDINSPVINRKIQCNERFIEHSKTIKYLLKKKSKVVIISHQGRKGRKDFINLRKHAKILSKLVGKKIQYVDDLFGKKAINKIKNLKDGEAIVLKNVREFDDETKNLSAEKHANSKFVRTLSPYFEVFVLDAFSVSHRNHASVVGFARAIKNKKGKVCIGPVLEKELRNLKKIYSKIKKIVMKNPRKLIYLLSGSKPEENFLLLKKALKQKSLILCGGTFCLIFLIAKGFKLGKSDELKKGNEKIIMKIKKIKSKIIFPVDFAIEVKKKRKEISLEDLPINKKIFDIGEKTIKIFEKKIKEAEMVIVKGPLGKYEDKNFSLGTKKIFEFISKSKVFGVFGGGNTIDAIKKFKIKKRNMYVSLGGGALLYFLSRKKLPGIEELK